MSETINIPRDTTMQLLVKVHRDQIAGEMDLKYKEKVAAATSKAEVDALFAEWWKIQYNPDLFTKSEMLERWFGNVLVDTRVVRKSGGGSGSFQCGRSEPGGCQKSEIPGNRISM